MATIIVTSSTSTSTSTTTTTEHRKTPSTSLQHQQQHQHQIHVSSMYYTGKNMGSGHRDPIDLFLDVLTSVRKYSKPSAIRNAAKMMNFEHLKPYLATLCHYGLVFESAITKKAKTKNKKTGKHEIRTIRRYYVTPKGHALIRLYDIMIEQLVTF